MTKNKGLGRGLGAIFEAEGTPFGQDANPLLVMEEIKIEAVVPNPKQPRSVFNEDALEELADSIKTLGLIQPITVKRDKGGKYIIISGERRWRASQLAGLATIPAYIREADDQNLHEMALVENIQRQDLNVMEIAISLHRLMEECNLTQDAVSSRVGKKRSTVANYLRLLSLPVEVQSALKQDAITMVQAKAIAAAPGESRIAILKKVMRKNLSVRQTEDLVKKFEAGPLQKPLVADEEFPDSYTHLAEELSRLFTEDVKIKKSKGGGGKIVIGFSSDKDVESFLGKLEKF